MQSRTDYSPELSAFLQNNQERLCVLGTSLAMQYQKNHQTDPLQLQEWLQLKNVVNMYRVCDAFYRGSLFYSQDPYHFASKKNFDKTYLSLTTVQHLNPIVYARGSERRLVPGSYLIDDACESPARVLNELLFSCTRMDCTGSIGIVYHLTLLDLLKVIHGDEVGTNYFDTLFAAKPNEAHDFNRLRLGMMGNMDTNRWPDFSPIYYFGALKRNITLEQIKQDPTQYIGARIFIQGYPKYLEKHPHGAAQGWNVIVLGQSAESELLYLAANEKGKKYVYTHSELISMLAFNYNVFPDCHNAFAANSCSIDQVGLFFGYSSTFNLTAINKLLSNFDRCMQELKRCCDGYYQKKIICNGYQSISYAEHPLFVSSSIIKKIGDDHDSSSLRFFRPSYRTDTQHAYSVDDGQLAVGYRLSSKR